MNKTIDINLAGVFFHIDETAYTHLKNYLEALRATFQNTEGKEDILADVEARIAELLNDRKANKDQVIEEEDIQAVVKILGQPEDFVLEEEGASTSSAAKKLFRDSEDSYVGGVASGLAHYFGLDTGWLRIIWVLLAFFSGGSFVLIYILFWILIPEAKTTAEKLQMKGEPVTVGNIEKKIKEEVHSLADKVKNVDYEKAGATLKKKSKSFFDNLASVALSLIKITGKLIGIGLIMIASLALFGISVGFIVTNVVSWISEFPFDFIDVALLQNIPLWILLILLFCLVGIPMVFLLIVGIKLVAPTSNPFGFWGRMVLFGIWLLSFISMVVLGTVEAKSHMFSYQATENYNRAIAVNDTLFITSNPVPDFKARFTNSSDFDIVVDENGDKQILLENVRLNIEGTDRDSLYISVQKEANGASFARAKRNAQEIAYTYNVDAHKVLVNTYLTSPQSTKFKDQEVAISLYIPKGQLFRIDDSLLPILSSNIANDQNYIRRGLTGHIWKMSDTQLLCMDCESK